MSPGELRGLIVGALEDRKGRDIVSLDVMKLTDFTDFMVVVTGTSNRHVRALVDNVFYLVKHRSVDVMGIEGRDRGEWVLIDLGDVVVHVMQAQTRSFYDLERLWGDIREPSVEEPA
jgi:ribosome-associated protein